MESLFGQSNAVTVPQGGILIVRTRLIMLGFMLYGHWHMSYDSMSSFCPESISYTPNLARESKSLQLTTNPSVFKFVRVSSATMPHSTSRQHLSDLHKLPTERGTLSFIQDLPQYKSERPYRWAGALETSEEHKRTNIVLESRSGIAFADLRGLIGDTQKLSLRHDGFQILRRSPRAGLQDPVLGGDDSVLRSYLSGLALEMKGLLSAELVVCVNFVVSRLPMRTRAVLPSKVQTPWLTWRCNC